MNRKALLKWYSDNQRSLPWRNPHPKFRRSPYQTWISEIMLQQTQVKTVIAYFKNWLKRFPNTESLAKSAEKDVLNAWAGLGYYSRARSLRKGALYLMENYKGEIPEGISELLQIPGVGPYTAGAISSLAYNQKAPILDGNLIRIFSRYMGWGFLPEDKLKNKSYWDLAKKWANCSNPGDVNEALMELGAIVCTKTGPSCRDCPLKLKCYAYVNNRTEHYPPAKKRKSAVPVEGYAWLITSEKGFLLSQRKKGDLLGGQETFPWSRDRFLKDIYFGLSLELPVQNLASARFSPRPIRHSITHHKIKLIPVLLEIRSNKFCLPEGFNWYSETEIDEKIISSLSRKLWETRLIFQ